MDIESFYEQNEARRESAEFEFGSEWTDSADNEYELSWVEATGELYLMVEPDAVVTEDIFGDFLVSSEPVSDLTVVVIGKVASLAGLEDLLEGWEEAMLEENSLVWLRERLPEPELEVRGRRVGDFAESRQGVDEVGDRHSFGFIDRCHERIPTAVDGRCGGGRRRRLQQLAQRVRLQRAAPPGAHARLLALALDGEGALHVDATVTDVGDGAGVAARGEQRARYRQGRQRRSRVGLAEPRVSGLEQEIAHAPSALKDVAQRVFTLGNLAQRDCSAGHDGDSSLASSRSARRRRRSRSPQGAFRGRRLVRGRWRAAAGPDRGAWAADST